MLGKEEVDKIEKPVTMDLYIGIHDNPSEWQPKENEFSIYGDLLVEGVYAYTTDAMTIEHPEKGHHPSLRFEDIVAHLTMQAVVAKSIEHLAGLIKTARQYGNQVMKKVCRNCTHSLSMMWDSPEHVRRRYTADGMEDESSIHFANDIASGSCALKCGVCRVARTIVVANKLEELYYGSKEEHTLRVFALKAKDQWYKTHCKLKKMRWERNQVRMTLGKVIEAKRELTKDNYYLNELVKKQAPVLEIAPGIHMTIDDIEVKPPEYNVMNMTIPDDGSSGIDDVQKIPEKPNTDLKYKDVEEVYDKILESSGVEIPKKPMPDKDPEPPKAVFDEFKDVPEEVLEKVPIPDNAQIGGIGSVPNELDIVKREHVIDSMPPPMNEEEEGDPSDPFPPEIMRDLDIGDLTDGEDCEHGFPLEGKCVKCEAEKIRLSRKEEEE